MRFKFHDLYREVLVKISEYSTCNYYKVGAILVNPFNGNMVFGYNGTPSGVIECHEIDYMINSIIDDFNNGNKSDNIDEHQSVVRLIDKYKNNEMSKSIILEQFYLLLDFILDESSGITITKTERKYFNIVHSKYEIHAEQNCLLKFNENSNNDLLLYVSMMPCFECAKLIIASNKISDIYYINEYIDKKYNESSINLLKGCGINVYKL